MKIQNNLVVTFTAKLTAEAVAQLEAIEVVAGVRQAPEPIAPPTPPKSEEELLEEEVRRDWVYLPTNKVRHKFNNRKYKAMFDKLMADDQLKSQVTSYTDGGAEFRQ